MPNIRPHMARFALRPNSPSVMNGVWSRARPALLLLAAIGAALAGACAKATSDNIQLWKTTQKGPERLHDALVDRTVAPRLRAEAAVALVDIGRADEVDAVMAQLPADERADIIKTLIPTFEVAMKDPSPDKSLSARDALFSIRAYATPEEQKGVDGALLPAIANDLRTGRLRNGRHSIEKVLTAIGPDSGKMLAEVLAEPIPSYPLAADLLGKVGDEATRNAGARALIARAQKERSKEKPVPPAMWRAIGSIGGPAVARFLQDRALGGDKDEAAMAVRALGQRRDPAVLPFALKVAGDAKADKLIRDEMFGVIEGIGGLDARKGLINIIATDREELVRYRAFEVVLSTSKAEGIIPALDAFPAAAAYKKVDVDDLLVRLIEKLGASARPVLVQALESRAPLTRMTAVMALEQIGGAAEAPALTRIAGDATALKGFPAGETIGKQASRVAEALKKKT
ncbi:MAG TPA: HEAT repeat domain-containing protein [Polyangia bacterium]|nr:HEAT repeat domain-containing protein [Polyangia bacterium]